MGGFEFIWALSGVVVAGALAMIGVFVAAKPVSHRGIRICFFVAAGAAILGIAMWGAQSPLAFWARASAAGFGGALATIALMGALRWARTIDGTPVPPTPPATLAPAIPPPSRFATELAQLDQQAATIRAVKLYEARGMLFANLQAQAQEGRKIIVLAEKDKHADKWPYEYGAWRTNLKNFLAQTEPLLPGLENEVLEGIKNPQDYLGTAKTIIENIEEVEYQLHLKLDEMPRP